METLFSLGRLVSTPAALEALARNAQMPLDFLEKHAYGDWGCLGKEDKEANNQALKSGGRIFSAYLLNDETKIWVITEADRSSTCVLLPSDY